MSYTTNGFYAQESFPSGTEENYKKKNANFQKHFFFSTSIEQYIYIPILKGKQNEKM